jgi:NAD(P)-dependent dehydrogenase (short-subunit alcohol dehydrogenase family)
LLFVPRIGKQGDITKVVTPVSSTNAKFQELPAPTGKSPYHLELYYLYLFIVRLDNYNGTVIEGTLGNPDEIAKALAFLASDDSSYVIGIELFVDWDIAQI